MGEVATPPIRGFQGKYRFLSNFWPASVWSEGYEFPSVETAYQASKCAEPEDRATFISLSPGEAKRFGRRIKIRPDWDTVKIDTMLGLLRQKFSPAHEELREQLLNTGDAELVEENTWGDRFWGVCGGHGANHLGRLLMQVREEIREEIV